MTRKRLKTIGFYALTIFCALLPLAFLYYKIISFRGGEFYKMILHFLGDWSMYFLVAVIFFGAFAVFKKRKIYRQLLQLFGVFSAFYAILHIAIYLLSEVDLTAISNLFADLRRAYLFYGFTAFLLILFLTIASFTKKFQKVASLSYVAGILAGAHFMLGQKLPSNLSYVFFIIFLALLCVRLLKSKKSTKKKIA